MARTKRIRIYLNGNEVGTGILSDDEKTVESIRIHPHIPEKDRDQLLNDRSLKVEEQKKRNGQ